MDGAAGVWRCAPKGWAPGRCRGSGLRSRRQKQHGRIFAGRCRRRPIWETSCHGDGNKNSHHGKSIPLIKSGAILANAGQFDVEIDKAALEEGGRKQTVRKDITEYEMEDGRGSIFFVTAAGQSGGRGRTSRRNHGHDLRPANSCCCTSTTTRQNRPPGHRCALSPGRAGGQLQAGIPGIRIDDLTEEQEEYLASWKI